MPEPVYLIYDGECCVCENFARTVKSLDWLSRIEPRTFQEATGFEALNRMDRQKYLGSFHLIFPGGRVKSGEAAVPELLMLLPLGAPAGLCLKYVPGMGGVSKKIYEWLATVRK